MDILVIGGGISDERSVSLRSAKSVAVSLEQSGHKVKLYDWDGSQGWLRDNLDKFDVVFPVLHGVGGEDGQIQSIIEDYSVAYVGTRSQASANCMSKRITQATLTSNGVLVPDGLVVDLAQYKTHSLRLKPHVLKPVNGGSSIDTLLIDDSSKINADDLDKLFNKHQSMLLEEQIVGQEITVPYLQGKELPVIEIIPPDGQDFDFDNKYNGKTQELCPPKNIPSDVQQKASKLAKQVHHIMDCRHFSRTDMIVKDGQIYVLEINTIPGMTDQSLFPKAASVAGMTMPQLTDYLVIIAKEDDNE